ncbi:MAG: hypothetical protein AB1422_17720 [bacterium]
MTEIAITYWHMFQKKGDKLIVLLGRHRKAEIKKVVRSYLSTIIGIFIVGFMWVFTQIHITSMGYTISLLQNKVHQLENFQRMLLVDIASLRSPDRIDNMARQMGLTIPDEVKIVCLPQPQYLVENKPINLFKFGINFFKLNKAEAWSKGRVE